MEMDSNASKNFIALAVQHSNNHDYSTITVSEVRFSSNLHYRCTAGLK